MELQKRETVKFLIDSGTVKGPAPVIFGEPGDAKLLGAVTLASLGLALDFVHRDLGDT